jgi:type IV pilus assembly protein PilA
LAFCFVATTFVAPGCKKKDDASSANAPRSGKVSSGSAAAIPSAQLKEALQAVPSNALAVASVAFPMSLGDMSTGFGFLPFDPALAKKLQTALIEHSQNHLGINASGVRSIVIFADGAGEPSGAAIFSPVEGTLEGEERTEDNVRYVLIRPDGSVVATQTGTMLIVGTRDAVKAALASAKGGDSLAKSDTAFAKSAKDQVPNSYFSVTADATKLPLPDLPMTKGLSHAGARFSGDGLHLALHGDNETLELLSTMAKGSLQVATNLAKDNMEKSQDDFFEGTAGIMGYYMTKNFGTILDPTIKGDVMTLDFPFEASGSAPMIFVAVTGVLAAVAIPAFMKYIKKSKASEANVFIKNISDRVQTLMATGGKMPASVGPTPPLGTCCAEGEKCMPDTQLWEHPTWKALDFAMLDPHRYSYEFVNKGSSYEIKAYGDLDCDGVYSTFVLPGGPDMGASGPTVYKENELE